MLSAALLALTSNLWLIVDGDTLKLDGQRYRLEQMDAPESKQQCLDGAGHPYAAGSDATAHMAFLIGSKPITCTWLKSDVYGRPIASCTVAGDTMTLNEQMVRDGWATAAYGPDYFPDELVARTAKRGICRGNARRRRSGGGSIGGEGLFSSFLARRAPPREEPPTQQVRHGLYEGTRRADPGAVPAWRARRGVVFEPSAPPRRHAEGWTGPARRSRRRRLLHLSRKAMCFACDVWDKVEHNIHAIAKTIEAMRGIARWGTGDMLDRAFSGFTALPPPTSMHQRSWRQVLDIPSDAAVSRDLIESSYRPLAKQCHPDAGGSNDRMAELNKARADALREISP